MSTINERKITMAEFAANHPLEEIVNHAETTKNKNHLWILSDFPNHAVTMAITKNQVASGILLLKLAKNNLDVPPLLKLIAEHSNCTKEVGSAISWAQLDAQKAQNKKIMHGITYAR